MALVPIQDEFLRHVCELVSYAHKEGFMLTGGDLWRSKDQQQVYVIMGKSKTMDSQHLKRLAIDLNVFEVVDGKPVLTYMRERIKILGDFWESLHEDNVWGGSWESFVDKGHFERRDR